MTVATLSCQINASHRLTVDRATGSDDLWVSTTGGPYIFLRHRQVAHLRGFLLGMGPRPALRGVNFHCVAEPSDRLNVQTVRQGGFTIRAGEGALVRLTDRQGASLADSLALWLRAPEQGKKPAGEGTAYPTALVDAVRRAAQDNPSLLDRARSDSPSVGVLAGIFRAADKDGLLAPPKPDLSGYMAPCPPGFGTVLGHLVQQDRFPEDLGLAEGVRLAKIAMDASVPRIWVDPSPALAEVCGRVRAYPADFLVQHLGSVTA